MQFELAAHGRSRILANATPAGTGSSAAPEQRTAHAMSGTPPTTPGSGVPGSSGFQGMSSGLAVPAAGAAALAAVPAGMYATGNKPGISGEVPAGHAQLDPGSMAGRLPDVSGPMPSTSFGKPGIKGPDMPDMPGMNAGAKIPAVPDMPGMKAPDMPDMPSMNAPDMPSTSGLKAPGTIPHRHAVLCCTYV